MVGGVDVVVTSAADQNFYLHLFSDYKLVS